MTNLHGISEGHLLGLSFWCINSFYHFILWGSRSGGQFSTLWARRVMGRLILSWLGSTSSCTMTLLLPYVSPPPGFTMRSTSLFCHLRPSFILLLGSSAGTAGGGLVVSHHHLGKLVLFPCVPSLFILGLTLNPFKERSTGKHYVFPNPIIWNLGPPIWAHHSAQEMGGVKVVEGLTSERLDNLHPEVFNHRCPPILIPLVITIADILQGVSIL